LSFKLTKKRQFTDPGSDKYGQVKKAATGDQKKKSGGNVTMLRLASFVNDVVGRRKVPDLDVAIFGKPRVLMKLDIEGSEVEVLPDLIYTGSLQHLDAFMVEFHDWMAKSEDRKMATKHLKTVLNSLGHFSELVKGPEAGHAIKLINLDDESYFKSKEPLPKC
jgi:hypothetical protein